MSTLRSSALAALLTAASLVSSAQARSVAAVTEADAANCGLWLLGRPGSTSAVFLADGPGTPLAAGVVPAAGQVELRFAVPGAVAARLLREAPDLVVYNSDWQVPRRIAGELLSEVWRPRPPQEAPEVELSPTARTILSSNPLGPYGKAGAGCKLECEPNGCNVDVKIGPPVPCTDCVCDPARDVTITVTCGTSSWGPLLFDVCDNDDEIEFMCFGTTYTIEPKGNGGGGNPSCNVPFPDWFNVGKKATCDCLVLTCS